MKIDRSRAVAPPDLSSLRGSPAVSAIKALANGEARPDQQKLALDWIIDDLARTYDLSFRPDDAGGDRESAFAEGRRFVGLQLRKMIVQSFTELTGRKTSGENPD